MWQLLIFNVFPNIAPFLFFAAYFNLFNFVYVSLTLSLLDNLPLLKILIHFLEKILISFLLLFLKLLRQKQIH